MCSLYHKVSQYIAKLRRITIDLYKSHLITVETPRYHTSSQHRIVFIVVEKYVRIVMNFLISKKGAEFLKHIEAPLKSQSQPFCADAYFVKETLSVTPRP